MCACDQPTVKIGEGNIKVNELIGDGDHLVAIADAGGGGGGGDETQWMRLMTGTTMSAFQGKVRRTRTIAKLA